MTPSWLDPLSKPVRSAVVSGAWGKTPHSDHSDPQPLGDQIDTIAEALARASSDLSAQTAFAIHPAIQVVEDYVAEPAARRLSTYFSPLRSVVAVTVRDVSGDAYVTSEGFYVHGDVIRFTDQACGGGILLDTAPGRYLTLGGWFGSWFGGEWRRAQELVRVTYNAGSTITSSARAAVLSLAHEYYLQTASCDECGTCRLPTRTTSVQREGLTYTTADPLDPLSSGGTGLPDVDLWTRTVNPRRVDRASGVYTPDAPPSVVVSVQAQRDLVVTP